MFSLVIESRPMGSPAEALGLLVKARAWLSDSSHWCQGSLCENAEGWALPAWERGSNVIVRTCSIGACSYAQVGSGMLAGLAGGSAWADALWMLDLAVRSSGWPYGRLCKSSPGVLVAPWNDAKGRTHDEVLAVFDAAILRLSDSMEQASGVSVVDAVELPPASSPEGSSVGLPVSSRLAKPAVESLLDERLFDFCEGMVGVRK